MSGPDGTGVAAQSAPKLSKAAAKAAYRRAQKKKTKNTEATVKDETANVPDSAPANDDNGDADGDMALVQTESMNIDEPADYIPLVDESDDVPAWFKQVSQKFMPEDPDAPKEEDAEPKLFQANDDIPDEEEEAEKEQKLSKKKQKILNTPSVAELKARVEHPELVEWTDVRAPDPDLLLYIKSLKNVVPVPSHWNLKREYLSSKRGIEKAAYALPKFIADTGIAAMRDAILDKQKDMSLKQKQRERVQGKTGKMDLDYGKMHAAFFVHQEKPHLTKYAEVYYEGKEYETNMREAKVGELSMELQEALGMPPGVPPPWLINQQRAGPPPAYPGHKVPGVNAPIPPGASWGFLPGQWGKPPLDDQGRPLFGGDPMGTHILQEQQQVIQQLHPGAPVERRLWGQLPPRGEEPEEEEEEEEEEDEDEDEDEDEETSTPAAQAATPGGVRTTTPSEAGGIQSISGEFALPKKPRTRFSTEPESEGPRSAYQVIPEKNIESTGFFGGEHAYDIKAARVDQMGNNRKRKAGYEVSVDVDALDAAGKLDKEALSKQYDAQKHAENNPSNWSTIDQDDLTEMINEQERKRQKIEAAKRGEPSKSGGGGYRSRR